MSSCITNNKCAGKLSEVTERSVDIKCEKYVQYQVTMIWSPRYSVSRMFLVPLTLYEDIYQRYTFALSGSELCEPPFISNSIRTPCYNANTHWLQQPKNTIPKKHYSFSHYQVFYLIIPNKLSIKVTGCKKWRMKVILLIDTIFFLSDRTYGSRTSTNFVCHMRARTFAV